MMQKYADSARVKCSDIPERVHLHLLQYTRAMRFYRHGMDLTLVSSWLGHVNLETNLIYAHADTEQKCQAIARALGDTAAPGVDTAHFSVSDDELLKLYMVCETTNILPSFAPVAMVSRGFGSLF